jgi:hypothetical protein
VTDDEGVRLNDVGDVVLENSDQLRALADSVSLAAFTWLQKHGPASLDVLVAELSVSDGSMPDRLAKLASAGLARHDSGLWSAPGHGLFLQLRDGDEDAVAAARDLSSVMLLAVEHLPREWVENVEPGLDARWAGAAGLFNAGVRLTAAELDDVQVELERVLEPYLNRAADDVPADARRVRLLAYFLPDRA